MYKHTHVYTHTHRMDRLFKKVIYFQIISNLWNNAIAVQSTDSFAQLPQ